MTTTTTPISWTQFASQSVAIPVPLLLLLLGFLLVKITSMNSNRINNSQNTDDTEAKLKSPNQPPIKNTLATNDVASKRSVISNSNCYRTEEEAPKLTSFELSQRGKIWSCHPSWHLPSVARMDELKSLYVHASMKNIKLLLQQYQVDPITGFLPPEEPLQRLPSARYHLWEDLTDDLPKLVGARFGSSREILKELPVISTDQLTTEPELRRAHLLLCLLAHAFVWGGDTPADYIPEGIARPLWEVSQRLGLPPILIHTSLVLYNWRRLDTQGQICMENIATLNNFFDGRDESWFYLITVEIEAKGAAAIMPLLLANDAIQRFNASKANSNGTLSRGSNGKKYTLSTNNDENSDHGDGSIVYSDQALSGELVLPRVVLFVTAQLKIVAVAISKICGSLSAMREGCHPFIFYHRVRTFLSGWKHNPTLPDGLLYEGVSSERKQYYGGSAAQSSLIPLLDISLGIEHENAKTKEFFSAMRDYMAKPHREFLRHLETTMILRSFIVDRKAELSASSTSLDEEYTRLLKELIDVYDECVKFVERFRTEHIAIVAEYVMAQQKAVNQKNGIANNAGGKGTGGTDLMEFLKPIRDDCTSK